MADRADDAWIETERRSKKRRPDFTLSPAERMRRKKEYDREHCKSRIYIGTAIKKWRQLKDRANMGCPDVLRDEDWANILLKSFLSNPNISTPRKLTRKQRTAKKKSATGGKNDNPSQTDSSVDHVGEPVAETSGAKGLQLSPLFIDKFLTVDTGTQTQGFSHTDRVRTVDTGTQTHGPLCPDRVSTVSTETHDSHKRPAKYTTDLSPEEVDTGGSAVEMANEPCITVKLGGLEDASSEEEEEEDDDDDCFNNPQDIDPRISHMEPAMEAEMMLDNKPYLVFTEQLCALARWSVPPVCPVENCQSEILMISQVVDSVMYLHWNCEGGHYIHKWCSQPLINRGLHAGGLLAASAAILSGNSYKNLSPFMKFLNLPFPSASLYNKIHHTYLAPAVDSYWSSYHEEVIAEFQGKDIVILGDAQLESPKHSVQCCTFVFMEYNTNKILRIVTKEKVLSPATMNTDQVTQCFQEGLHYLIRRGLRITEVVTDQHAHIAALMKKQFPSIRHSFDVWQEMKILTKKLFAASQDKDKKELLSWSNYIVNHFWTALQVSETSAAFASVWSGILHHIVNEHIWSSPHSPHGFQACEHGQLDMNNQSPWLKRGSSAYKALGDIVWDNKLLDNIPYYLECRSTAALEMIHDLTSMYASSDNISVRNKLVVIDYNKHIDRKIKLSRKGKVQKTQIYSKKRMFWYQTPVKVAKEYSYIPSIMKQAVEMRLRDVGRTNKKIKKEQDDPRKTLINPNSNPTDNLIPTQGLATAQSLEPLVNPNSTPTDNLIPTQGLATTQSLELLINPNITPTENLIPTQGLATTQSLELLMNQNSTPTDNLISTQGLETGQSFGLLINPNSTPTENLIPMQGLAIGQVLINPNPTPTHSLIPTQGLVTGQILGFLPSVKTEPGATTLLSVSSQGNNVSMEDT